MISDYHYSTHATVFFKFEVKFKAMTIYEHNFILQNRSFLKKGYHHCVSENYVSAQNTNILRTAKNSVTVPVQKNKCSFSQGTFLKHWNAF